MLSLKSFSFANIEHVIASVANDIVKGAKIVAGIASKVSASEAAVEKITAAINPNAVAIERAAYQALGLVAKAANDTTSGNGTITVSIAQEVINDFKQLYAYITNHPLAVGAQPTV